MYWFLFWKLSLSGRIRQGVLFDQWIRIDSVGRFNLFTDDSKIII